MSIVCPPAVMLVTVTLYEMKSPSLQWDLLPFELPFTQLENVASMRHGSSVNGLTCPFVHWSMLAAGFAALAIDGMIKAAATSVATSARPMTVLPRRARARACVEWRAVDGSAVAVPPPAWVQRSFPTIEFLPSLTRRPTS